MALSITIAPEHDGWALTSDALQLERSFASGAHAEAYGRDLAGRLSQRGQAVDLAIILRDGTLAATIPFRAAA